ncbi:9148_t:CDS:2, partial [Funneliformis geosporum]
LVTPDESENAIRNVLRSVRYVLAMDVFANKLTLAFLKAYHGEDIHIIDNRYKSRVNAMVEIFYDPNSRAEAIKIGYGLLRALVEKAFKLSKPDNSPVRACIYYGDMDGKQRQKGFSNINDAWDKLNCVAYTNTVKADISFEITRHFDIVITITNITTSVHVETLAQMLYQIPIKKHREWNNNIISYKVDSSSTVITFIEVEHQKHLSARYFIEKLCSLIASISIFLQLIKMDESREVIGNRKRVHNEVRVEALVIKNTNFNAVATS